MMIYPKRGSVEDSAVLVDLIASTRPGEPAPIEAFRFTMESRGELLEVVTRTWEDDRWRGCARCPDGACTVTIGEHGKPACIVSGPPLAILN